MAKVLVLTVLVLASFSQHVDADSFIDKWLAQHNQIIAQMTSSSSFDQDEWLSKQKANSLGDFLATKESSQGQQAWTPAASWEAQDLEQSLLSDIQSALGKFQREEMESRIKATETSMHPMFQALPKNEYGKLGHASVRYMLHRFFVEEHGWFIDGLYAEGAPMNTTSPSQTLKNRVPMFVEGLFEKRLGGRGFGVHEMAVLFAIVEHSVHEEAQVQLSRTYSVLGLVQNRSFPDKQTRTLIEAYMSAFVMNTNMSTVTGKELLHQSSQMSIYYPTWPTAKLFFDEIRLKHAAGQEAVSFSVISSIIREIVDKFGTFHGKQCQGLKQTLQEVESANSMGCVRLPDFYAKGLKQDSNWMFVESKDYLREIGVLDETHPLNPSVLSANYVNSPTNCLQPSGYYLVCCHNECDDILGSLERKLMAPSATPDQILAALSDIKAGPEAKADKVLAALRFRLEEVAEYNSGRVPIHGRLFAQWLHHVYPRECPFPHLSGTKSPQFFEDFEKETGKATQIGFDEMAAIVRNASMTKPESKTTVGKLSANFGSCAPWQDEEELFAPLPTSLPLHALEDDPHLWQFGACISFVAAIISFVGLLARTGKTLLKMKKVPSKMMRV